VTERGDGFSEAVVHRPYRPAMAAGIKGPTICRLVKGSDWRCRPEADVSSEGGANEQLGVDKAKGRRDPSQLLRLVRTDPLWLFKEECSVIYGQDPPQP
jgi:hypothetical protein